MILSKIILIPALKRLPEKFIVDEEGGWMNSNLLEYSNKGWVST
jgi:hypothetical protein